MPSEDNSKVPAKAPSHFLSGPAKARLAAIEQRIINLTDTLLAIKELHLKGLLDDHEATSQEKRIRAALAQVRNLASQLKKDQRNPG